MNRRGTRLSAFYVCLSLIALVTCWRQNLLFMQETGVDFATGFIVFWPALLANHATTSITVDILLLSVAAMVWMVHEARRVGIRLVWLYILLSFPIGVSVMFPLFLVARERALASPTTEPTPTLRIGDGIGLGLISLSIICFAIWTLGQ
jgi:Terpene cyclase DEP1